MRLSTFISAVTFTLLMTFGMNLSASNVDFTITPNSSVLGPWSFYDISATESQIKQHPEQLIDNNDKVMPYGLTLANTFGYPNGKSIIENFEAGIATGAAVYKYDRYENFSKDNPEIPGVGANAAVHFGFGLTENTDITFKLFIDQGFYTPDTSINKNSSTRNYEFKLKDIDLISAGAKWRYNLVGETGLIPFILSFGGVTAGFALDFTHGKITTEGMYQDIRQIKFDGSDPYDGTGTRFQQLINVQTTVTGKTEVEWNVVSVTPEIMTYIDLFYLFSIYTGPAVSLNAGNANFTISSEGEMKNLDPIYRDSAKSFILINSNQTVATGSLKANAPLKVPVAVPLWKLGLEINLWALKLQVEGATVLTSPTNSFTAQIGTRVQF